MSQSLLTFLNRNNMGQEGVMIDAMSQYFKLLPDQSDLNGAFDDGLDHIDSHVNNQLSAASSLGPPPMRK